jgi:bleomycin hydrolase
MRDSVYGRVGLDTATVSQWSDAVSNDATWQVVADAAWRTGLRTPLTNHKVLKKKESMHLFQHIILPRMKPLDQEYSGTCWIFAGLNVIRRRLARVHNLPEDFSLSQAYLIFYDKLEKAFSFLDKVKQTKDLDDDRLIAHIFAHPVSDGGNWTAFVALVNKYGVVPQSCMIRSDSAKDTLFMNRILTAYLRQVARRIRADETINETEVMQTVHRLLSVCLGRPPSTNEKICWTYADKEKKVHTEYVLPRELLRRTALNLGDYVLLTRLPDRALGRYHVKHMDTMVGGPKNRFYNVESLSGSVREAIRNDSMVWFGCEWSAARDREDGILHHELLQYERILGEPLESDPKERLAARAVAIDHAMAFIGYNDNYFQVENSHGTCHADGVLAMSQKWMERHVFTVAVPRECAIGLVEAEQPDLEPWDVLGEVL